MIGTPIFQSPGASPVPAGRAVPVYPETPVASEVRGEGHMMRTLHAHDTAETGRLILSDARDG